MNDTIKRRVSRFITVAAALAGVAALGGGDLLAQTTPAPQPSICTRACWGATSSGLSSTIGLNRAIVHHTAGTYGNQSLSHSKSIVRAVQAQHKSLGWGDIGYHFLSDALGNIFEGRRGSMTAGTYYRGAHDGTNSNSYGFSNLGNYESNAFTTANRNANWDVIAWRMPSGWSPYGSGSYNGKTVGVLDGHRSVKATACPGANIWATIGTNYSGGTARDAVSSRRSGGGGAPAENAAMTTAPNGRVWFAQTQNDGFIYTRYFDPSISPPWGGLLKHTALPNVSLSAGPAIVGHANGDVRWFAVTTDGKLHTRVRSGSGGGWGSVDLLGANDWSTETAPVAVLQTSGKVAMAGVKEDGALITRIWNPSTGSWGGATEHGLPTWSPQARPALVAGVDGRLHLLAVKESGALYSRAWSAGSGWGVWVEHHDRTWSTQSGVAAIPRDNGNITWVAMKGNGTLRMRTGSGTSWGGLGNHDSGWSPTALPAVVYANNRLWLFATKGGGGARLYHRSWTSGGGWGSWINNGTDWSKNVGPTAIAVPSGGLLWISTKADTNLRSRRLLANGTWNSENSHGTGWVK